MSDINQVEIPALPWQVCEQGDANEYCLITSENKWVIGFRLNGELMPIKQEAIIRYIVACVNACSGMSTDDLDVIAKNGGNPFIGNLFSSRMKLEKQRDDLLAAIVKAREDINWMLNSGKQLNGFVFDYIDAAIASVKGSV